MKRLIWLTAAAFALSVPLIASAANGVITGNIHLRAGPGWDYPMLSTAVPGTRVVLQGCLADWSWCDVGLAADHGWVPGNYVQYDYIGQEVPVLTYGQKAGIPVVTFEINSYWGRYYRDRPFYGDRGHWSAPIASGTPGDHGPPPRAVPLPHPIPGPPIKPPPRVVPLPHPIPGPPVHPNDHPSKSGPQDQSGSNDGH